MSEQAIDEFVNISRREAGRMDTLRKHSSTLLVTSYDPDTYAIKGTYQPEGKESGWIPLATQQSGSGYGITVGPKIGDQYEVAFSGGDLESPYVLGRIFSDKDKAPKVESGEVLARHESGTRLFLNKDGEALIDHKSGSHIHLKDNLTEVADPQGNKITLDGSKATIALADGTAVVLSNGKVYLGGETNAYPVETTAGPSTKVLAQV